MNTQANSRSMLLLMLALIGQAAVCNGQKLNLDLLEFRQFSPESDLTDAEVARRVTASTVWLNTETGHGTGWVYKVDKQCTTIITNHHVVVAQNGEVNARIKVYFPEWDQGRLIKDVTHYLDEKRNVDRSSIGQVIDSHPSLDLAIIHVYERVPGIRSLPLASQCAKRGEKVHAIGGKPRGSEALWIYNTGFVRSRYHQSAKFEDGQDVSATMLETTQPINPGDSGGPVVNQQGMIVGVNSSYRPDARLVSHCIDVSEVKKYLDEIKRFADEPKTISDRIDRAAWQTQKRNTKLALADIECVLNQSGGYAQLSEEWYEWLAKVYISSGQFVKGVKHLTAAIASKPDVASLYQSRSNLYLAQRSFEKAAADYARSVGADKGTAEYYWQRFCLLNSKVALRLGSSRNRETEISKAISLDPTCAKYRLARANLNKSVDLKLKFAQNNLHRYSNVPRMCEYYRNEIEKATGKIQQTRKDYYIALMAEPDDQMAWRRFVSLMGDKRLALAAHLNNTAWKLTKADSSKEEDFDRAIAFARQACWITKYNNANYLDTLAAAYAKTGQFKKAMQTQRMATAQASSKIQKVEFTKRLDEYTKRANYLSHVD